MLILVKLIGIVMVGFGIIFLVSPNTMRKFILLCEKGKRVYIAGILRILFGVIFLLAASQCGVAGVMVTLGVLFIIAGVTIFILKLNRIKTMLRGTMEDHFLFYASLPLFL